MGIDIDSQWDKTDIKSTILINQCDFGWSDS